MLPPPVQPPVVAANASHSYFWPAALVASVVATVMIMLLLNIGHTRVTNDFGLAALGPAPPAPPLVAEDLARGIVVVGGGSDADVIGVSENCRRIDDELRARLWAGGIRIHINGTDGVLAICEE